MNWSVGLSLLVFLVSEFVIILIFDDLVLFGFELVMYYLDELNGLDGIF